LGDTVPSVAMPLNRSIIPDPIDEGSLPLTPHSPLPI
jgi:hypothetical protein